jgi:DNA-binding MurR/RpiR family transcriptional regulator
VAISFRRVDRATVGVLRHAVGAGAQTIVLTDHLSSPAARAARLVLIARLGPLRLMPSYAAGASLINALLTAVALLTHDDASRRLEAIERLLQEFGAYAEP